YIRLSVGAGSSGSVLANRLSEDPSNSVLVVEAGGSGEWSVSIAIPFLQGLVLQSKHDWGYKTEPQKFACKGLKDQRSYWPRGRVLGGSSSMNGMVYVRGSRHDFDDWAANGCQGWSYKDVLPYFIKSENIQISDCKNSDYHGKDGPLHVSSGNATPLADIFGDAMEEMGYRTVDTNGEDMIGYSKTQLTTKNGVRCDTAKAFLRPAMSRPNLHVSINTIVSKVIIENGRAVGIKVIKDRVEHVIRCNKEVILSAGSIGTPQILLLSGIGPAEHLNELRISVQADLPVGQNLQDHLFTPLSFFPNESLSVTTGKLLNPTSILQWIVQGTGYLSISGLEGNTFVKTNANDSNNYPDIQMHLYSVSMSKQARDRALEVVNLKPEYATVVTSTENLSKERFQIFVILLHPKSRGTIKLRSTDPFDHPIIDPNYLSESEDVETMIRGIRFALKVANTSVFNKFGIDDTHPHFDMPSWRRYKYGTDAYWEEYIRHLTFTVYHPSCTCAMGRKDDPEAVVDPNLRVRGIENLRVADCSVMRNITSGNTNAPTIMIGEKAADLILQRDSVKDIKQRIRHILDKV
ncbi:hypothetical protein FSP39_008216, partial [Pinctada imbricata]